ncbi:hypothetical protein SLEP1_g36845 [Rubroshorea leprosula]|uniref:Uncharacterized protein n=1 Tax=Rubroshorea leprosula TaxID=152421 RepID=A0AAV5KT02_9ROSI|nr:hypothetical protein SLEP1_g36845 [Rubroshorea leprosula]
MQGARLLQTRRGAKRKVQGWCRACAGAQADARPVQGLVQRIAASRVACSVQQARSTAQSKGDLGAGSVQAEGQGAAEGAGQGAWAQAGAGRGRGRRLVQARRAGDLSPFLFFCSAALFLLLGMLPVLDEREG